VINTSHENPKYLPGISLGSNVIADPNLESTVKDADIIIFCAPHQFLRGLCKQLIGKIKPDAFAISLIKVMRELVPNTYYLNPESHWRIQAAHWQDQTRCFCN
jgi:glycerol-3-phosphate dehydrogenase